MDSALFELLVRDYTLLLSDAGDREIKIAVASFRRQ